ncbi:hypothetical protein BD309DRAFT_6235 [Dichomitus squalens]|nr:hypothetical protein BD309DRAFT_6235 [Dichomitus squalens]
MQRTSREGCEEDISFNFDLYYHRSRLPSTLLHFPVAMFILSFVFAGILMLGVLEPRFTMTLLSHTMPQAELLLANAPHRCRRLASQYLLAQVPWTLQGERWLSGYLRPTLSPPNHSYDPDPNPLVLPDPGVDTSHVARMTSPMMWATFSPPYASAISAVMPLVVQLVALLVLVLLLRWSCFQLADRFRLTQRSSPARQFVQDLENKVHGRAMTGSGSPRTVAFSDNDDHPQFGHYGLTTSGSTRTTYHAEGSLTNILGTPVALASSPPSGASVATDPSSLVMSSIPDRLTRNTISQPTPGSVDRPRRVQFPMSRDVAASLEHCKRGCEDAQGPPGERLRVS